MPTKANLFKKLIVDSALSPICKRGEETVMHALWTCPAANDAWAVAESPVQKWKSIGENFLFLWTELNSKLTEGKVVEVAAVMKSIWMRRNAHVF